MESAFIPDDGISVNAADFSSCFSTGGVNTGKRAAVKLTLSKIRSVQSVLRARKELRDGRRAKEGRKEGGYPRGDIIREMFSKTSASSPLSAASGGAT